MDPSARKYFEVLGLRSNANADEIKVAFKKLAFQYHPDRNPHNAWAEEKFKEAVEAYSFLSGNLEAYRALKKPTSGASTTAEATQDIFKILFDIDLEPASSRPRPLQEVLELSLEDAFKGRSLKIPLQRYDICPECFGSGVERGAKTFTCTYCFGEGEVEEGGSANNIKECPKCNGRGFLSSRGCVKCRARGAISKKYKLQVNIPPKVSQGQTLTLLGEGHEYDIGKRGEVQLTIHLKKHDRFTFDGKDIICETTVEVGDAALGGEISVPTLQGKQKLKIAPGTQSGQVARLKGLGLGGDQFVRIWVKTPTVLNEKERNILRGLRGKDKGQSPGWWNRFKKWVW